MGRIEGIKERLENVSRLRGTELFNAREEFQANAEADIETLLAKLEQAEKALESAKDQFDRDDHQHFDGGTWSKYIESTEGYKRVVEALKDIRE
jgi:hypothetical protein